MNSDVYTFEPTKLNVGGWSLMLLKNDHMIGGFISDDFDDLKVAGETWLQGKSNEGNE